ncbi:MAG: CrcB family protein [Pseudomonadota bacterium]
MNIALIGLGGAIGAMLRYGFVVGGARLMGPGFPWGVFAANVVGSFLMGVAAAILLEKVDAPRVAAFLMPGVLGGFTTFSAFSLDAVRMIEDGRAGAAALYIGGSVALAIAALALGLLIGRALT